MIAAMVKARECCRRLVQAYEQARTAPDSFAEGRVGFLRATDVNARRFLHYLRLLPRDLGAFAGGPDNRLYAARLRAEIRELLERAMILERETRRNWPDGAAAISFGEQSHDSREFQRERSRA